MSVNAMTIKGIITGIGFAPQDGKDGIYYKCYSSHDNYTIFVDFNNERILYDSMENPAQVAIIVHQRTTSNFSKPENFVVLECVDSLLEKGYSPANIELEKTYPSGRGHSGSLDILVRSVAGVPFLMIECKTWGSEFEKEKSKMLKSGGQLFSYYANDRAVEYLCLYTSCVDCARMRQNAIVDVDSAWVSLSGVKEIHDRWNKNFKDNGIFDDYATPYDVKHKALTYGKLETLQEEHSGKIYNQIMEILRHNAISDKPNAFNKLLNLFVCKIIDEADKNPEDELEFQWLESDSDESLQLRLNDLYKKGMWRFLEIDVIDYAQQEVSEKLANVDDERTRQWIMKMYTDTRLKKSPNFAFVEVQDDRTFELNAKVVREIVELLQVYKFRYGQKHEFLGNFFELLLNTSMKQEAGQFFTPVPITRFIISSLPLAELVQSRVNSRQSEPLPTVIDYACGSGHFLTEYMAQMQEIIDQKIDLSRTSPMIRNLFQSWQGYIKFAWAKDSVYGIDLDNRLVKTTKVSAFFNGDGEANIVLANGLDSFTKSRAFRGKLLGAQGQDNGKFDILISNPPYSVDAFKSTIEYGQESFELYSSLTDNSSEIECLFIERMKQLLKIGGWAAVILPSSILSNSGIYAKARALLLKYFKIKAIVELSTNTFMKTNTSTVILFLERRNNDDHLTIQRVVDRFFTSFADVAVSGIEKAFSTFVSEVYDGLPFEDYVSLFDGNVTEVAKAHELYEDYQKAFGEDYRAKAIEIEKEKLLYFLLTYPQTIVLVKTGKGKEEKKFLGYEFSERRGHEGLHHLPGGTKLYDETDPLNPQRANSYIYRALLGKQCEVDNSLAKNVSYGRMSGFVEYGTSKFNNTINLGKISSVATKWRLAKIADLLVQIDSSQIKVPQNEISKTGRFPVVTQESGNLVAGYCNSANAITDIPLVVMGDHTCTFKYIDFPFVCGSDNTRLLKFDHRRILPKFAYYTLNISTIPNTQKYERHFKYVKELRIPLPPLSVQQAIVDELEMKERDESNLNEEIERTRMQIDSLTDACHEKGSSIKLRKVAAYSVERTEAKALDRDTYVGVDNLLPNIGGKYSSEYVPSAGSVTAYHTGDILLSNIRPYLKKAWLADNDGGCSGDVLVLRIDRTIALPEYVFLHTSSDRFFEYEMQNIGSNVKMPRADKKKVLDYQLPILSLDEQKKVVEQVSQYGSQINHLKARLDDIEADKKAILKKLL